MILAVDVSYRKDDAIVAGLLFKNWQDEKPVKEMVISCSVPDNYLPGQFYRRELPCIAALLEQVTVKIDCILIDGFVFLGKKKEPGLGKHLRDMLEKKVVVIGVAKNAYKDTPSSCAVLRGNSNNPLYVTADGIQQARAKVLIQNMHGPWRIPTLLKRVDQLCRKASQLDQTKS